jgi:folate-dependent phosphoribosylglycinamide formyltransferase PurN
MLNGAPFRVAVLCSQRAPGLRHLLQGASRRGRDWNIACCLTSEETFEDEGEVARHGVPILRHPVRRFYGERDPRARIGDLRLREEYDRHTAQMLAVHRPDLIVLAGYLLLLTRPMLSAFGNRILNVHHSDLLLRDAAGRPRYPGLRAVRDAILAGESETRCTVHVVTERLDDGPPLLLSEPFPVSPLAAWARETGAHDVLRSAIWAHQEWMLRSAFGPLLEQALDALADVRPHRGLAPLALEQAS